MTLPDGPCLRLTACKQSPTQVTAWQSCRRSSVRSEDIASRYQAILCDVWGVVHNGVRTFRACVLRPWRRAREQGLAVVLITNAPRPSPDVVEQLKSLGVPAGAWDAVVTSGDVTRDLISGRPAKDLSPGTRSRLFDL